MAGFRGRLPGAGAGRAEGVSGVMSTDIIVPTIGVVTTLMLGAGGWAMRRLSQQAEQIYGLQSETSKRLDEAISELRAGQLNLSSRLVRVETLVDPKRVNTPV